MGSTPIHCMDSKKRSRPGKVHGALLICNTEYVLLPTSYFSGFSNKDVAFLHVATKTLIVADLLFNLPANEQYSQSNKSPKVPIIGKLNPESGALKWLLWKIGADKNAMQRDIKAVRDWDFDRIIMCHGDVIESNGKKAWEEAYSRYLS
jgi:hypothetical protein